MLLALSLVAAIASPQAPSDRTPAALRSQQQARDDKIAALRDKARQRVAEDSRWYGPEEVRDIEARYDAMRHPLMRTALNTTPEALAELIERYPHSTRAGCAALKLATGSAPGDRERALKSTMETHGDAWCDDGIQVGAMARAYLAIHFVERGRFEEAERLAVEIGTRYPGAIDPAGAPLDDMIVGIKLLRR